jgi:AcrR family transcriptional regulator
MQMTNSDNQIFQIFSEQPRKGDLKKLEIIQAAIECISSIGFEKTTYEAIAKIIGTRRAHIAYHFKDKSDIFKAFIQFINYEYQNILFQRLDQAKNGKDMILLYVECPFIWAEQKPKNLSTMLLFYYLCGIDNSYNELNDKIRKDGNNRIVNILQNEMNLTNPIQELKEFALNMQNIITGSIIDAVTTQSKSMDQAKQNTKKHIKHMLIKLDNK